MMTDMVSDQPIAFNRGVPPPESFPQKRLIECARQVINREGQAILQYGSAFGYEPLREWIAGEFSLSPQNVIIGQGSLQLLDHLAHAWLRPDDLVFVEQPTYDRTLTIFRRAGLRLRGYPLVDGVIDLDAVEADLRGGLIPRLFYVVPDFQNPSGALMPTDARRRLVRLAEQFGFLLVEDGPYRQLRYNGDALPTLQQLSPRDVLHMSSFSKLISPGMRVGYMVGAPQVVAALGEYAQQTYISPSGLDQAIAAEFIRRGWMTEHLGSLLEIYRPRLQTLLDALEEHFSSISTWIKPQGGFFVGLTLHNSGHMPKEKALRAVGVTLSNNQGFFIENGQRFIRLPFCALTPQQIVRGVTALRDAITP